MIAAEAIITGGDTFSVSVSILVTDIGGPGIRHVQVVDRLEFILEDRDVPGCPHHHEFPLASPVARMRLGIDVIVTDCNDTMVRVRGLLSGTSGPQGSSVPNCNPLLSNGPSAGCLTAQSDAQDARNRFIQGCNQLNDMRNRRDHLLRLIATLYAAAAAFAIAGALALAAPYVAFVLFAVALFFLAFAVGFSVVLSQVMNQIIEGQTALNQLSAQFQEAANRVHRLCCEWNVNLDQPSC